ncbi:MAG: FAD-binding oxidoreductase, partial [Calditrichaeota bacterium]
MEEIVKQLEKQIQGEVRFDRYSRVLYSTDASIYQIEPLGVVIPKTVEDVQATVELAYKNSIPIIPRGGGTSLVGQSIGAGIIIDFSKYLHRVLEVNTEEKWARVQPGVVLDELNLHLQKYDLIFAPDTATSNRANLGGLIGNNSCGARSIVYGKTIDHVIELKVLLSNGEPISFAPLSPETLQSKIIRADFEGKIYQSVSKIIETNKSEIERRYPKILRRVGGYNLDALVKNEPFNLAKLIVGSEGTLAVVTEARVRLVSRPKHRVLAVLHFQDLFKALEAVPAILKFEPSAVELLDKFIIKLTRATLEYARQMTFVEGDPAALLLVEFQGDSKSAIVEQLDRLVSSMTRNRLAYASVKAIEEADQARVWSVRKAGLGLLMGLKGERKPVGFVEDTAVPVQRLAEYIRRFDEIIREHETEACYYAHASVGCLHVRPLLNLKSRRDIDRMRTMAEKVSDLVLEFGGAMSGEHGDGLARSCFNEKMFGTQLYQAFHEIKGVFDPKNIMNPGKIVDAQHLTENLRYRQNYPAHTIETFLDFSREGGFASAIELCNGNAMCRKKISGVMCPSYMVTREEEHSTRGRANALRAVLSGQLPPAEFTSRRMYEVLDLCIACKGCKGECPTNVDMAKLKYEFLYHYHKVHGVTLRDRMFANIATLNRIGCVLAPFSNWLLRTLPMRWFLHLG